MSTGTAVHVDQRSSPEQVQEWVRRAVAGDRVAAANLFEAYYDPILNFLVRETLGDKHLAEDVTQNTFESVGKSLRTYQPDRAPFLVWLKAVARNKLQDHYRRSRNRTRYELPSHLIAGDAEAEFAPSAEDIAVQRVSRADAVDMLRRLPPVQAALVALVEFDGLSVAEAAIELDLNPNTAKVYHSRALRRLSGDELLRRHRDTRDKARKVVHTVGALSLDSAASSAAG